ncbi:glycosyl hydrolase family 65 protein [Mycoplasma crocodyli]|uniref:Trehalose/maltose hydrolase (Family 65 glycosyl hydrolase) n=1 Tax=Mycoplasma crocodyli (strain ATCC 51981 / MP145) TaxID=512564 RepID=D5E6C3_MYCCM|nr:glycosyl hydrolase family 65 protein [Mycoplasma crocodyli]ADE19762.1 trehalose/maltose hydrolase (family 65 glycosyl hydrolase) [Mycoplasma crocodyli MP145]
MEKYLSYDIQGKKITQDKFNSKYTAKTESIFSLGNGYLGLRSADEELDFYNKPNLFVNGIFNKDTDEEVSELANLADSTQTMIDINGETFQLREEDLYNKTIDIRNGILTRTIQFKRKSGLFQLVFQRFVSQEIKHVYAQKISLTCLENYETNPINVKLFPTINGQVNNTGTQHFKEGNKRRTSLTSIKMEQETTHSKRFIVHNMVTNLTLNGRKIEGGTDDYVVHISRRAIGFNINLNFKQGDTINLEKIMSVNTSIDIDGTTLSNRDVDHKSSLLLDKLQKTNYKDLLDRSIIAMRSIWNQFDVKIKGDENAEFDLFAMEFGIFHMNNFIPKDSVYTNVGAKGLSGEGYQGHTYWDTEFFINPNYLFTDPKIVRNLLTYRYLGINGAREKALSQKLREEESNLQGAQYPWEMAWPTDGEVCPYWGQADVVSGKQVPIASRRQEIHVSADIAYAVNQYFIATGDQEFMDKMGYEMIIDTAIFYANRAELNKRNKSYEIKDVMGPNEYKGNINNNAYTNYMVKYNIGLALDLLSKLSEEKLEALREKLPYEIPTALMETVYNNIKLPKPNKDGVISENDQFLNLVRNDISNFQMLGDAGKKLFSTTDGQKLLSGQLVKQADVVLLTYIMPHLFDKEIIEKNFDFYEPITTHDSSLSSSTYALQAIRLRKMDLAYKLFQYSLNIDLGQNMKSSDAGIHAGSLAAIWQVIIFGYGGFAWYNNEINIDPILPKTWSELTYSVTYQGVVLKVVVNSNDFTVWVESKSKMLKIKIQGNEVIASNIPQTFKVRND